MLIVLGSLARWQVRVVSIQPSCWYFSCLKGSRPLPSRMPTGRVKMWLEDRGFGFIVPDDGGDDVIVHRKIADGDRTAHLIKDETVTYEVEYDSDKGKYSATSCEGFHAGEAAPDGGDGRPPRRDRGGGGGREVCRDFLAGKCDRDRCRFSHDADRGRSRGRSRSRSRDRGRSAGGYPAPMGFGYPPYGGPLPGPYGQPPLPYGWEAAPDPASGRIYYRNRGTGESSWTPPPMAGPPPYQPPPLPRGWEQAHDPASGRPYFHNRETGETSWTPPPADGPGAPRPSRAAPGSPRSGGLPAGWEEAGDPASGKTYYFNRATNETTWTRP